MVFADPSPCPCGLGAPYAACCGKIHLGLAPADDARTLMRARYSAFAKRNASFLLASWAPETRPASIAFPPDERWTGLTVGPATPDPAAPDDPDRAVVAFTARWRRGETAGALRETSRFRRVDGAWFYVDGNVS